MNKKIFLFLQGIFILLVGFLLILMPNESFLNISYILIGCLVPGLILGMITALKRINKHIQFTYQVIHAFAIFFYLISLIFFCSNFEDLNNYTGFYFIFYAFSEIIFCNFLFNSSETIKSSTLIVRIATGLACGVGTVVIFSFSDGNQAFKLIGDGIIFSIIGFSIIIFRPVIKNEKLAIH